MLSLFECKKILNKKITDEELNKLREFLYQLAQIEFDNYKMVSNEKSSYIYKSFNGRTKGAGI